MYLAQVSDFANFPPIRPNAVPEPPWSRSRSQMYLCFMRSIDLRLVPPSVAELHIACLAPIVAIRPCRAVPVNSVTGQTPNFHTRHHGPFIKVALATLGCGGKLSYLDGQRVADLAIPAPDWSATCPAHAFYIFRTLLRLKVKDSIGAATLCA
jgi:hypothetical protein